MSRKTSIPPKRILGDSGVQTYRACDKGFAQNMRDTTFKRAKDGTASAIIIRESEFAKPYGEQYEELPEDFSGMEYGAPSYPVWGFDFPGMADPEEYYAPWKVVFFCDGEICYCPEQAKTNVTNCSWEIIDVKFSPPFGGIKVSFSRNAIFTIADENVSGCKTLKVTMRARFRVAEDKFTTVTGSHYKQVCECDEDECEECDDTGIAWDYGSSAETIAQSGNEDIYITDSLGTGGPYSWAVSPPCFNLDEAITVGLVNTLNADADACGPATITVTGCDGTEVSAVVRCTTGEWDRIFGGCGLGVARIGPPTGFLGYGLFERIIDERRQTQQWNLCLADPEQCCETGCGSVMLPCPSVGGPCNQNFSLCIYWEDVCDENLQADSQECGDFKCSWPFGECNEKPGCICHHSTDRDYYEWECEPGDSCT